MLVTLTDNIEQTARLVSATDYYPFGMAIHSRSWQSEGEFFLFLLHILRIFSFLTKII
ncbi:MAG: hypothetical protein JJT94_10280 [Bernardetiaceae bacterium]|nr:hypothetical protein [Bernardetiaceae bacterium]